ncbi:MAG: hypothetical protein K6E10_07280 [Eubacterium sp.]|nr:hypothetical protein [Eubacterium sp.]
MNKKIRIKNLIKRFKNNCGTTLVEMIVTFAMLAILMTVFATIISSIVNMYYDMQGETYGRQVTDIVMEKVVSEIQGAKYSDGLESDIPVFGNSQDNLVGDTLSLYDKTDTHVTLGKVQRTSTDYYELVVDYSEIIYTSAENADKSREATTWKYDTNVYNGYGIKELKFVRADKLADVYDGTNVGSSATAFDYSSYMDRVSNDIYPSNVIAVFMTLDSPKYGEYKTVEFVRMYNFPENWASE